MSRALGQLRFGVVVACVGVALALITQVVVFSFVEFTDLRWNEIESIETAPTVVRRLGETRPRTLETTAVSEGRQKVNPNFVKSRFDSIFDTVASLSRGLGTMAMLGLTPLIVLGVLLAASAAMDGVDRTVSGFGWAMMVGILVLPVGDFIGLPWENGALSSYEQMTAAVDSSKAGDVRPFGDTITVYARFLILPLMCLAGLGVTAVHFHLGVEDGLLVKEDLRIDPTLEKDAGGRKAGAMGSRSSAAFRKTMVEGDTLAPPPEPVAAKTEPKATLGLAADPNERTAMKPITPDDHIPPRRLI